MDDIFSAPIACLADLEREVKSYLERTTPNAPRYRIGDMTAEQLLEFIQARAESVGGPDNVYLLLVPLPGDGDENQDYSIFPHMANPNKPRPPINQLVMAMARAIWGQLLTDCYSLQDYTLAAELQRVYRSLPPEQAFMWLYSALLFGTATGTAIAYKTQPGKEPLEAPQKMQVPPFADMPPEYRYITLAWIRALPPDNLPTVRDIWSNLVTRCKRELQALPLNEQARVFIFGIGQDGTPVKGPYLDLYTRAQMENHKTQAVTAFPYPLDPVSSNIFQDPAITPDNANSQGIIARRYKSGISKKDGKEVHTNIMISFNQLIEENNMVLSRPLTPERQTPLFMAYSLFYSENYVFTDNQLYRLYHKGRPSPDNIGDLRETLTILRTTLIGVDNSEERSAGYKYPDFRKMNREGKPLDYLLPLKMGTYRINGKYVEGYRFLYKPLLLQFAEARGQITILPQGFYPLPLKEGRITSPLIIFLTTAAAHINSGAWENPYISAEKLYEECGVSGTDRASRSEQSRVLSLEQGTGYTVTLLEHFIITGYIASFDIINEGRGYGRQRGIIIHGKPSKQPGKKPLPPG